MTPARRPRCHPRARALLEDALPKLGTDEGLLQGACAVAAHERPSIAIESVVERIDALARAIRGRVRADDERALLAHAHAVLFDEQGLQGADSDSYDEPQHSFVDLVLENGRGLPIVLVLVYVQVLRRVGLSAYGLDAPAHFLAQVEIDRGRLGQDSLIVDVFDGGRTLRLDEARSRIGRLLGANPAPQRVLRRATHSAWLLRIVRNLIGSYARRGRAHDRVAMEELYALLEGREHRAGSSEGGEARD